MVVPVKTTPVFSPGTPKMLFRGTYVSASMTLENAEIYPWDISPDGKRFLMIKPPETTSSPEGGPRKMNIVVNWFEELKQRVPVHVQ